MLENYNNNDQQFNSSALSFDILISTCFVNQNHIEPFSFNFQYIDYTSYTVKPLISEYLNDCEGCIPPSWQARPGGFGTTAFRPQQAQRTHAQETKEEDHQLHHCCWTGRIGDREEEEVTWLKFDPVYFQISVSSTAGVLMHLVNSQILTYLLNVRNQ